jgi:L-2-hydroxyglutarate oxidase
MKRQVDFDIAVIGGGIVGLASAYRIGQSHPGVSIVVLEKEERVASGQTGHNSGVIHSGVYYKPGSNKAKTCAAGRKELIAFAKEHGIAHRICGKIIVATRGKELSYLEALFRNGQENEIEGIEKIGPEEIREIEPFCAGIAGIRVPCAGVIDFVEVAERLSELIEESSSGNKVLTSHKVLGFDKHDFYTKVVTDKGALTARCILNCAGLESDRIGRMDGIDARMRIVPFRGNYYELTDEAAEKVQGLIYPVPDTALPFLGVHFTRRIEGRVECGPNAVFSFKREGYGRGGFSLRDTWDALRYGGTWKMFVRNRRYGLAEYSRAFCKKLFLKSIQRLIPTLGPDDIKPGNTGVRAQAVGPRGELIDDFVIERQGRSIHVLNAPSPAATASLAIADYVTDVATDFFELKE